MKRSCVSLTLVVVLGGGGCRRGNTDTNPTSMTSATASSAPASAASGSAEAASEPGAPPATAAGVYTGSFQAKIGAMAEVPKEAKVAVWEKDPGKDATGEGTLSLTLAAGKRAVHGEGKGALGELLVAGDIEGNALRARVDPKDPNAPLAMTGILSGTIENGAFTGTLRVSGRNGDVVREADIKLKKN